MDPLALLPYALAAAGGRVGANEVTALVAAGVTLLQRSAPLVRALAGRRAAALLPAGVALPVALAASDGRGLVLLEADDEGPIARESLDALQVGAVFTTSALAGRLPPDLPRVLLEHAPQRATVVIDGREWDVDLGSHFGIDLMGDLSGPGAPEECVLFARSGERQTHEAVYRTARAAMGVLHCTPVDRTLALVPLTEPRGFASAFVAPLLAGGLLRVADASHATAASRALAAWDATIVIMTPTLAPSLLPLAGLRREEGRPVKRWVVMDDGSAPARAAIDEAAAKAGVRLDWV